jgi:hypothetical protein
MAKIMTINDFPLYAEMIADILHARGGHEVKSAVNPVLFSEILEFDPDVIVISLVRKLEMLGHGPLHDFLTEVDGAKSFRSIALAPELKKYPIVLTSLGIKESEVPQDLPYVAFAHVPHELDMLLIIIDKIVQAQGSGSSFTDA